MLPGLNSTRRCVRGWPGLFLVCTFFFGLPTCPHETDEDGDGYGTDPEAGPVDCNDQDPKVHPGALEVCNEIDDDCDGEVDEESTSTYYVDADADGFGTEETTEACAPPEGYATESGDCNDENATVHPGAVDYETDGVDSDCGGSDGPQPSVGLEASTYQSIQHALNAAADGDTVWVGPGTWSEQDLSFRGKGLTLASTAGAEATIIDARSRGRCLVFNSGEDARAELRGFTLTGGQVVGPGAGILMEGSSPVIRDCIVTRNHGTISDSNVASDGVGIYLLESNPSLIRVTISHNSTDAGNGAGMYLDHANPALIGVTISLNTARQGEGGGMYLSYSNPLLTSVSITGNTTTRVYGSSARGGGLAAWFSRPVLDQVLFSENIADESSGGGVYLEDSSASLTRVTFSGNKGQSGGGVAILGGGSSLTQVTLSGNTVDHDGGGIYLEDTEVVLSDVEISGNTASYSGGGLAMIRSRATMTRVTVAGNHSLYQAGGVYLYESEPLLAQLIVSGNSAEREGGGMFLWRASAIFAQATVCGNSTGDSGGGIYLTDSSPDLKDVILAFNSGGNLWKHGSSNPSLSYCDVFNPYGVSHNLEDLGATTLEVDPAFASFTNDGDPSNDDLHLRPGSPLIDAGLPDLDGDGLTWETDLDDRDPDGSRADIGAYGGPAADWSGYADEDGDGLYDDWEQSHGLDPTVPDGAGDPDGDGATNLEEFEAGTDLKKPDSDRDGYEDGLELDAGSDALNACSQPGTEGLVTLHVPQQYRSLQDAVDAAGSPCRIEVAAGQYNGPVRVEGKSLEVVGPEGAENTFLDGRGIDSALTVESADLVLRGVTVFNGQATLGGGINMRYAGGRLESVVVEQNTADSGGGMYLYNSTPDLERVAVTRNAASSSGGGMYLSGSAPALTQVSISENTVLDEYREGGGLALSESNPTLVYVTISGNKADYLGGGLTCYFSNPTLAHVVISGNSASYGGGIYLSYCEPTLTQVAIVGNAAQACSGMEANNSTSNLKDSVLAYNTGNCTLCVNGGHTVMQYSDVYTPDGEKVSGFVPDLTNLFDEPGFLEDPVWDSSAGTWLFSDLHPGTGSPLVDAGDPGSCTSRDSSGCDPDGSRPDIGVYGGPGGGGWDRDADGYYDYFWPGNLEDAPVGFDPAMYDGDDLDPMVH